MNLGTGIKEIQLASFRPGNASAPREISRRNQLESRSDSFTLQQDFVETFCKTKAINLNDKSPSPCF